MFQDKFAHVNNSVHSTSSLNPSVYGVTPTNIVIFYVLGLAGTTLLLSGAVLLFILIVTKLPLDRFEKQRHS